MVSKVRNFWLCVFSGVVTTTLMLLRINKKTQVKDYSSRFFISFFFFKYDSFKNKKA